jgi:hypothetical protein
MELFFLVNHDVLRRGRHTVQDFELLQSDVRAHAARISHRRRRSLCVPKLIHAGATAQSAPVVVQNKDNEEDQGQVHTSKVFKLVAKSRVGNLLQPSPMVPKGLPVIPCSETRDTCELFNLEVARPVT